MGDLIIKPASSGNLKIQDQGGTERIALDTSGNITAVLGDSVTMASSGVTVRNISQVALSSNQILASSTTLTTFFSPTYTPLFSGSKVQGKLTILGFAKYNSTKSRKILKIEFTGNDITDITWNNDAHNSLGAYDYGNSGVIIYFSHTLDGPLITTTGTSTITANCKLQNEDNNANSEWFVAGNSDMTETFMTWIEYK